MYIPILYRYIFILPLELKFVKFFCQRNRSAPFLRGRLGIQTWASQAAASVSAWLLQARFGVLYVSEAARQLFEEGGEGVGDGALLEGEGLADRKMSAIRPRNSLACFATVDGLRFRFTKMILLIVPCRARGKEALTHGSA